MKKIGKYYKTDFFAKELNLEATLFYSADGYEDCKTKILIHEIVNDSTIISSKNNIIIGVDTIKANDNLRKYFKIIGSKGHQLFEYNIQEYNFPIFESLENTFYIKLSLSDNKILKDSCIVKISK